MKLVAVFILKIPSTNRKKGPGPPLLPISSSCHPSVGQGLKRVNKREPREQEVNWSATFQRLFCGTRQVMAPSQPSGKELREVQSKKKGRGKQRKGRKGCLDPGHSGWSSKLNLLYPVNKSIGLGGWGELGAARLRKCTGNNLRKGSYRKQYTWQMAIIVTCK